MAEPTGGPRLQWPQIKLQPDDREVRVERWSHKDGSIKDSQARYSFARIRAEAA